MKFLLTSIFLFILTPAFIFTVDGRVSKPDGFISVFDRVALETINYKRGVLIESGIPPFFAQMFENKLTYGLRLIFVRVGNSFEAHYLFFGGLGFVGLMPLFYLPLMIAGLLKSSLRFKKIFFALLLAVSVPVGVVFHEYNVFVRLPVVILYCFLAAKGVFYLFDKKRRFFIFLVFFGFYEFLKFVHDYIYVYPMVIS